jgi:hypothetical protein
MTEKFTFGEHPCCVAQLRHTMSGLKDAGAKVTVETTLETSKKFVLHKAGALAQDGLGTKQRLRCMTSPQPYISETLPN